MKIVFAGVASLVLLVVGCSAEDPPGEQGGNGVNDVKKACEVRSTWTHPDTVPCVQCKASTTTPYCECADVPEIGACYAQQRGKTDEPSCQDIDLCTANCAVTDCVCVDACYANKAACRRAASAVDGCVAETCAKHCL